MATSRLVRNLLYLLFGVCPILFFTDFTRNPYFTQIILLNLLIAACWIAWLSEAWKSKEMVWVSSPLDVPLLGLVGVSAASWLLSMTAHPNLIKSVYSEGSKATIFLLINTFLVYAAAVRIQDKALVNRLLWITYAVSFVAAMYGVLQYFGIEPVWSTRLNPYGNRPVSTFGNPNFMSSYLVVVMPVMIVDYFLKVTGCPRAILFIVIQMSLAALLATLTRSSWAGLAAGLLVIYWALRDAGKEAVKGKVFLGVTMLVIVLAWPRSGAEYSPIVLDRLLEAKKVTQEAYGSVSQRFLIWLSSWNMVLDHPFFGKGWGCFELFYPYYQGTLLLEQGLSWRTHANNAHNEIFEYWSQIGTVGLGVVAWLWWVFFRYVALVSRRLSGSWRFMAWGFMAGVAGMLVDNLLNVSVHFAVPAFIFWWWVGSAMALDPAGLTLHRFALHSVGRKALVGAAVFGLLCLSARALCVWAGEINFFKGFKLSKAGIDLVSAGHFLQRAYRWHQLEVNNNYELGNVYARLGEKEKALFMYGRALDANAGYDEIYFNRATLLMQMGRVEESIVNYRICLAINPLAQQAYNAVAGLYFKDLQRYGADIESLYMQGVRAFPGDKDMWNNLGYLYTQRREWIKAADAYQKALAIDPQFELAQRNLAVVQRNISEASKR